MFERDKYICQFCGQVGGTLNADHIKPFAAYPELRFELANGRTLCLPCHETTPTYRRGVAKHIPSPDQLERQQHVEADGGVYILARSVDDLETRKVDLLNNA